LVEGEEKDVEFGVVEDLVDEAESHAAAEYGFGFFV